MVHEKYEGRLKEAVRIMSDAELSQLASEIRQRIIESVAKNGGHLASNLGAVELTLALHRSFNTPEDKIIWDVGHQTYVHKMITGRWDDFDNLRQHGGISGFPKRGESVHDMYDSGHSGTSVAAALGYAKARDLNGDSYSCVAVIGDGAITGGVAFEALSSAGTSKTPLIVVLNDNTMSIGKNVGGISRYLVNLRTSKKYLSLKENVKKSFENLPGLYNGLEKVRDTVKKTVVPDTIFDDLGFKYYGPIDGHNIQEMCAAFDAAKLQNRPVIVHVMTRKGKGFAPAEQNPTKYHGTGPFDPEKADAEVPRSSDSWSDVFGNILLDLAKKDRRVVAITAAMLSATGLDPMNKVYPNRVFDTAIAEQNAVSFAAGLALGGIKPVVAIYSTFLQRAYDQIVTEVCLQNLPVIFAIDRAGVTGHDGETHQGVFDIAYLRSMPNMTILSPSNSDELRFCMEYAHSLDSPCAVRYPRGKASSGNGCATLEPEKLREGKDAVILTSGSMVPNALEAADLLSGKGKEITVVNLKVLKPLPEEYIRTLISAYTFVFTLEDGCIMGGIGEEIDRICAAGERPPRVFNFGWPDRFIEHGSSGELAAEYGLDAAGLSTRMEEFLENKA